jgi:hypothetical protein
VFNQIGIVKTRVLSALLHANVTTLMSDVDVVWLRDPRKYFASGELRRAHVAVSSDCVFGFEPNRPPTDAFGQKPSPNNAEFNTGVLLLRPTRETISFVERWTASQLATLLTNHEMNDQSHFNAVVNGVNARRVEIRAGDVFAWDDDVDEALLATIVGSDEASSSASSSHDTSRDKNARAVPESELFPEAHERGLRPRYYLAADYPNGEEKNAAGDGSEKRTRVALLPTGLFSNGHTFFVSRLAERSGVTPFAVHNTYQYSGTAGKIARFRENGLWAVDDAAYYGVGDKGHATDRKFLLLKYDVPRFLADPKRAAATPKGGTPHAHIELDDVPGEPRARRTGVSRSSEPNARDASVAQHLRPVVQSVTELHARRRAVPDARARRPRVPRLRAGRVRGGGASTSNTPSSRTEPGSSLDRTEGRRRKKRTTRTGTTRMTKQKQKRTRSVSVPSLDSSFARRVSRRTLSKKKKRRSASPRISAPSRGTNPSTRRPSGPFRR